MSKLTDLIMQLRVRVREAQLPPELETRGLSMLEGADRLSGGSREAIAQFEQIAKYIDRITALA